MTSILAASAQIPGELSFYNFVVFIHIAAVLIGFGAIFAYPVFFRIGLAGDPRGLPLFHRVQEFIGKKVISPGLAVILLAGLYLAAKGPFDFGEPFVGAGIMVVLVLGATGPLYFARKEKQLLALAERDIAAAQGGEVKLSKEYVDLARRVELVGYLSAGLVLVAILLMVFKPGT